VASKRQRQRQLARQRYQRRTAKQAQRDRRTRQLTVAVTAVIVMAGLSVGGVLLAGRSSGASPTPTPTPTPTPSASATASPTPTAVAEPATHCTYTAAGTAARKVSLPSSTPDYKATYTATINTNRGAIVIDLLNSKATCTVNSFVHLAEAAFFNNTPCFRLSTTDSVYILQCGDPTGKGSGGPGYEFGNENLTGATYPAGTLAMANESGVANSNGSQFFLVYKDSSLPPDYTPFGKIVSGLNIVQTVAKAGYGPPLSSGGGGAPKEKVQIESVTVKQT
jgi:peptidyl-prolyl cis-trans isomerase B (cyclophilin B)